MLGTLMKYEFKANGRILLPLYAAWIVAAVMLGLAIRTDAVSEPNAMMIVLSAVLYAVVAAAAVIVTAIILIQRFYKNLLGNEGYFMFTLPVSTGKHLTNKIVSGAVWICIGLLAAVMSAIAIAGTIEGFQSVFDGFHFWVGEVKLLLSAEATAPLLIIEIIIIAVLAAAEMIANVYAAISIGHLWGNHRLLGAILAYMALATIEGILGTIIDEVVDAMPLDWFYNMEPAAQSHLVLILAMAACAAMLAIYWFISWKLLDKRLNLE